MSRIYEALQKAESERGERSGLKEQELPQAPPLAETDPGEWPLATHAEAETVPMAGRFSAAYEHAEAEPMTEWSQPDTFSSGMAPRPAFDLDQVQARPWLPSLKLLPSLEERGKAVEQFRSLRSRLFELRDMSPLKSVLITSGLPQEGKSFVSTNLALSLARHKNKVLLIDGDMRRYTVHQILGCEAHPGLADYLAGKATAVEVMQRASSIEGVAAGSKTIMPVLSNLTFIAGGNGGDKAADLSGSPRFAELLEAAAPQFDWIIVDSSPVLPVSDAVNMARACDGVLLVARAGVTKFQVAQRAQGELKAANVLGFVLNAVENTAHVGGGYYGYEGYDSYDANR